MLELSKPGQCVELLAEIVRSSYLVAWADGTWLCPYCAGSGVTFKADFVHTDTCPIVRARKLLGMEQAK